MMTFHESYGSLPTDTLRLVKKYNVSPADYDMILDSMLTPSWSEVNDHIIANSESGYYRPRFF